MCEEVLWCSAGLALSIFTREASGASLWFPMGYESILGISADDVRPFVHPSVPPRISRTAQPILMSEGSFDRAQKNPLFLLRSKSFFVKFSNIVTLHIVLDQFWALNTNTAFLSPNLISFD